MTQTSRGPLPVDIHVGQRIRRARREQDISQERLAAHLGYTFQQVQKYERGANRVSASVLFKTAAFLGRPISWFFEGLSEAPSPDRPPEDLVDRLVGIPGGRELALAWIGLTPQRRLALTRLVQTLADDDAGEEVAA